jgi:hypothetical protein
MEMTSNSVWGRLRLHYNKQPLWLTENLLERVLLTVLGAFAIAVVCGACWLVVFVARNTQAIIALTDLSPVR